MDGLPMIQENLNLLRENIQQARDIAYRKKALRRLKETVLSMKKEIEDALWADLHKSPHEAYLTEISVVHQELNLAIQNLSKWAKSQKVRTPFFLLPSKSKIIKEPYGVVLIIAPWNYPFQLLLMPLISAIAAGNTVALKPSPDAPHTAKIVGEIVDRSFEKSHVSLFPGYIEVNRLLLNERFDYIFFTGSARVGKIVMQAAAKNLTPITLELGGKSPCVVTAQANLDVAARRIVWGKYLNAGQTCVAPDYVLIDEKVKTEFLQKVKFQITCFYGENPIDSIDYPRIINKHSLLRLTKLLAGGDIYCGGDYNMDDCYLSPTVLNNVSLDSPIMKEEIFGPILPILSYATETEALTYICEHEKPLALYYFGKEDKGEEFIKATTSGGACINDVVLHLANPNLPFGGVGYSGMGSYHGKSGFDTFTHHRSVLISKNWFDIFLKYPPYKKKIDILKKIM